MMCDQADCRQHEDGYITNSQTFGGGFRPKGKFTFKRVRDVKLSLKEEDETVNLKMDEYTTYKLTCLWDS